MGSPDKTALQRDGLGGGTSSTSKVVIVAPSQDPQFEIECLFGQVAIVEAQIDYSGICGNLLSAAAVFALEKGLVNYPINCRNVKVRLRQKILQQTCYIYIPIAKRYISQTKKNDLSVKILSSGVMVKIEFFPPDYIGGKLIFPTGNTTDLLTIPHYGEVVVSIVNSGSPTIFINGSMFNFSIQNFIENIRFKTSILDILEKIRCAASLKMGITRTYKQAKNKQAIPKVALVWPVQDYRDSQDGATIKKIDIYACIISMNRLHNTFTCTGAIALAVAASVPNTIVAKFFKQYQRRSTIRIGHPLGILNMHVHVKDTNGIWLFEKAIYKCTARTLMNTDFHGSVTILKFRDFYFSKIKNKTRQQISKFYYVTKGFEDFVKISLPLIFAADFFFSSNLQRFHFLLSE